MDLHLRNVEPDLVREMKMEAVTRGVTLRVVAMERLGGKRANGEGKDRREAKGGRGSGKGRGVVGRKRGVGGNSGRRVGSAGERPVGTGGDRDAAVVAVGQCPGCPHTLTKHHGFKGACQVDNCACPGVES